MQRNHVLCAVVGAVLAGYVGNASAAVKTWSGATDQWFTPAEWSPSGTPDLITPNDTAVINAGAVTYTPGGDFIVNSQLTIASGASWTQTSSGAWIKFGNTGFTGVLNLSGSFNAGGAGTLFVGNGGTGQFNVTGGSVVANSMVVAGTGSYVAISGGGSVTATSMEISSANAITISGATSTLNMALNEIKPNSVAALTINGAVVNVNRVGFDGGAANTIVLNGGRINITDGVNYEGIFSAGGDDYIDFVSGAGVVFLGSGATSTQANALLSSGRVRYNGAIDPSSFAVTPVGGGVEISAVPEPGAIGGLAALAMFAGRRRRR